MKILIVAGGTGGHIIPALTFGKWIQENFPNNSIHFVSGSRPLEAEIYKNHEVKPHVLPLEGSPLGKKELRSFLTRSFGVIRSILNIRRLIRRERPDVCLLFGGYVSLPVLLVAHLCRIPVLVHEQNAAAGKLTRLASRLGDPVLSGWNDCEPLPERSFVPVGVPVRKINRLQVLEAWNILHVGYSLPKGPIVVVMAGSLGSISIYRTICDVASEADLRDITFLLVGGKNSHCGLLPENVIAIERCWDLGVLLSVADGAIVRGGASSLYEMATYGIPSIVIPWEESAGNHQVLNAMQFVKQYGGSVWQQDEPKVSLINRIGVLVNMGKDLSEADEAKRRTDVNEKIWKEICLKTGREIL
jgi:UDP-N-acetylglucosamine--N-acetylmuramyl-(pentapeptide) pyrophosphoryl-undecaprenol N-acetylglucosamine transferase